MSEDILKKKKFRITPEFIDSIIESKIEKLLMQSAKNFIADEKREEKELNQYKRKVQRQKVMNRMSRAAAVVTTIATKALLFVGAILMGLFM